MNHCKKLKKLNRTPSHRQALLRNLSRELILNDRIETTEPKARALRPFIEKLVTMGKKGQDPERLVAMQRLAAKNLNNDRDVTYRLFHEIVPRFADRDGGYTRIIKVRNRRGDNAPLALIEFVESGHEEAAESEE